eukprot:10415448-Lingulodinium_polyedra.AAC.1
MQVSRAGQPWPEGARLGWGAAGRGAAAPRRVQARKERRAPGQPGRLLRAVCVSVLSMASR